MLYKIAHFRTSIAALQSLTELDQLELRGNQIRKLSDLTALTGMRGLRRLSLRGNPICQTADYPVEIFKLQPSLQQIDEW